MQCFFYVKVYLFKIFMIYKNQFNFDPVQLIFRKIWPSRKLLLKKNYNNSIPCCTSSLIRSLPYANQITVIVFVHVKCILSMILTTAFDWMLCVSGSHCASGGAV